MYTKEDLTRQIKDMNIDPKGTLFIHSSMKAVGKVEGGADTVIDVWMEYMKDGLLAFPTHTWLQVPTEKQVFDVRHEPSCVGILSNIFWQRPEALRSLHPTHSVAAFGKDAKDYINGEEKSTTPCPRNGCMGKLVDRNATILFLGCTLRSNTFIHGVEEWNNVPDRLRDNSRELTVIDWDGISHTVSQYGHHCSLDIDVSENYSKLEQPFLAKGALYYGSFGDAKCILTNAVKMNEVTSMLLQKDNALFSDSRPVPEAFYKD